MHENWFKRDPKPFNFSTFFSFLNFRNGWYFRKWQKFRLVEIRYCHFRKPPHQLFLEFSIFCLQKKFSKFTKFYKLCSLCSLLFFCSPAAPPLGATKEKNIEPVLNLPMSYHAICSIISQNPHYYSFRTPRERDKVTRQSAHQSVICIVTCLWYVSKALMVFYSVLKCIKYSIILYI